MPDDPIRRLSLFLLAPPAPGKNHRVLPGFNSRELVDIKGNLRLNLTFNSDSSPITGCVLWNISEQIGCVFEIKESQFVLSNPLPGFVPFWEKPARAK